METIVVGLDGSLSSRAAAHWAARRAVEQGSRVVAVHAVPRTGLWSLSALQVDIDGVLAELRDLLEGPWVAPLRDAGVDYSTRCVRGDPAVQLLQAASEVRAALLVLGSTSHSAVADLIVGGTVHKVINRSTIPVVLVPNPIGTESTMASEREGARRRTVPDEATRTFEETEDAAQVHDADRDATDDESAAAERAPVEPGAARHYAEMADLGARQRGEGRVP